MKKFEPLSKPQELDFYEISSVEGKKFIHIFGYTYESDSNEYVSEENPNGVYWANMECSWFIEPLENFIANLKANENYVDDTYCELNQYQGDYTAETIVSEVINVYFDGKCPDYYLGFEDITMDTPCGTYAC